MDRSATGTQAAGQERGYLPPMGRTWLLPLYDPLTRLSGIGKVHRRLIDQADLRPGQTVVEIGCGTGNLLLRAKATHPETTVMGLDPDLPALARARRKARRRSLEVRLDHGFADGLPYPDAGTDAVFSAFMLHHVPAAEKEPAMREVLRVLRPDGALHLVDMGQRIDPDGRATRRARRHEKLRDDLGDGVPELLRRAGFDTVTETGTGVVPRAGRITYYRATRSTRADTPGPPSTGAERA
jgi:ubiquinone/menaquinone biosynthesis C-methylase UbiE